MLMSIKAYKYYFESTNYRNLCVFFCFFFVFARRSKNMCASHLYNFNHLFGMAKYQAIVASHPSIHAASRLTVRQRLNWTAEHHSDLIKKKKFIFNARFFSAPENSILNCGNIVWKWRQKHYNTLKIDCLK